MSAATCGGHALDPDIVSLIWATCYLLKSVGLHKLKGDRKGQWAMTVNERWRICFEFQKGDAFEVEIVDYYRG
jgi:proteic killer suppression protein